MSEASGSCLCHQVRYQISGNLGIFQYCHCSRCRKISGSAHSSNLMVKPEQFQWIHGSEFVGRYEPSDTKHFATCFCTQCGSALPWLTKSGQAVIIPAGTLDEDPQIRPSQNIYCDSKASWYLSPASLPEHQQLPPRK